MNTSIEEMIKSVELLLSDIDLEIFIIECADTRTPEHFERLNTLNYRKQDLGGILAELKKRV